jgi:tRNA A-37 threonylcarbamoyl transferase component Bud32
MEKRLIAERYEVTKTIGQGASGTVYACRDTLLNGLPVALKIFPKALKKNHIASLRVSRELRSAFRVQHDNVVRFYDVVQDGDLFGFSMELMEGGSLEEIIDPQKPLDYEQLLGVLGQACRGLAAIHLNALVHRDLKPANILLTADGMVKIADFGIAKELARCVPQERIDISSLIRQNNLRATPQDSFIGTADYVAPEYVQSGICDTRADIYSLGTIAFELAVGGTPFSAETVEKLLFEKISRDAPALAEVRDDCPKAVNDLIATALSRNPESRFQSAGALYQAVLLAREQLSAARHVEVKYELGQVVQPPFHARWLRSWDGLCLLAGYFNPMFLILYLLEEPILLLTRFFAPQGLLTHLALVSLIMLLVSAMGWTVFSSLTPAMKGEKKPGAIEIASDETQKTEQDISTMPMSNGQRSVTLLIDSPGSSMVYGSGAKVAIYAITKDPSAEKQLVSEEALVLSRRSVPGASKISVTLAVTNEQAVVLVGLARSRRFVLE